MNKKNNKGITLVALIITIVVLIIIASITIYSGKETISKANLEAIKTNMLLIKAKARECVEEVNFKLGPNKQKQGEIATIRNGENGNDGVYTSEGLKKVEEAIYQGISIPDSIPTDETVYWVAEEALRKWGLDKIELENGEAYFVKFDEDNVKVEVYNNLGFDGKYALSEIEVLE